MLEASCYEKEVYEFGIYVFISYQGLYCNEYKLFLQGWYSYEDLEEPTCDGRYTLVIPRGDGWLLHVIYRLCPDYSSIGSESGYVHHATWKCTPATQPYVPNKDWLIVGPASRISAQYYSNIGSMSRARPHNLTWLWPPRFLQRADPPPPPPLSPLPYYCAPVRWCVHWYVDKTENNPWIGLHFIESDHGSWIGSNYFAIKLEYVDIYIVDYCY